MTSFYVVILQPTDETLVEMMDRFITEHASQQWWIDVTQGCDKRPAQHNTKVTEFFKNCRDPSYEYLKKPSVTQIVTYRNKQTLPKLMVKIYDLSANWPKILKSFASEKEMLINLGAAKLKKRIRNKKIIANVDEDESEHDDLDHVNSDHSDLDPQKRYCTIPTLYEEIGIFIEGTKVYAG